MANASEWGPQRHNFTEELLTVLYVLERMAQGTTLNQLIEIMDETTEINYFDYRNALEHLLERKLIFSYPSQTGERYILSISGRQSLAHFVPMIKGSVRDRIARIYKRQYGRLQAGERNHHIPLLHCGRQLYCIHARI